MGCDGFNFDTAASAGDADFLAALEAIRKLKEIAPKMAIELGMSSEFVLGLHGEIAFDGVRLAGMYPHDQVKMAEAVGADIFGPAVNVKANKSTPWNLTRAVTFVKETVKVAGIPVHPNVGMGVFGLPLYESPPIDCTTRAAKALVQIGKDEEVMHQVRQDLDIATLPMIADGASGIVAKCRIAELLGIELNSVNKFKSKFDFSK